MLNLTVLEGEQRARDLDLAEVLGYQRPRAIRELIGRLRNLLEACDKLHVVKSTDAVRYGVGGRLAGREAENEYWLTRAQAAMVCARSETPMAEQGLIEMARVFAAWQSGELGDERIVPPVAAQPLLPPQHLKRSRDGETVLQVGNCVRLGFASAWRKHPAKKRCRRFFLDCSTMEVVYEEDLFKPRAVGRVRFGAIGYA